ncbi:MAG: Mov34/MPN/PAD-1 family protein, partial [Promethearchaeota archaeon]
KRCDYLPINILKSIFSEIKTVTIKNPNREVSGFIFGSQTNDSVHITKFVKIENDSSTRNFVRLKQGYRKDSLQAANYLGFYHSHKYSTIPSRRDISQLKLYQDEYWLIGSLNRNKFNINQEINHLGFELKAYKYTQKLYEEVLIIDKNY